MANESQNLQNHTNTPTPLIGVTVLVLVTLALVGVGLVLGGDLGHGVQAGATVVLAVAVGVLAAKDRFSDLCLQDRIIRLEMQVRLAKLGLDAQGPQLALNQLISLRFASDAELPALLDKVLREKITSSKEIKKLIKDWQADYKRI